MMKKIILSVLMFTMLFTMTMPVFMASNAVIVSAEEVADNSATATATMEDDAKGDKAIAAAIAVGLAAAAGAIGMGMAISKSADAIARQPEAEGKIRTTLMLGLVFVETAIIYALVIAILIIFVL